MAKKLSAVEAAALAWWRTHKPCSWSAAEHKANPTINTVTSVDAALASAVADQLVK